MINLYHESVMVTEAVRELHVQKNQCFIDATLGTGGHSIEIMRKGGKVLGIEADPKMIFLAENRAKKEKLSKSQYKFVNANFSDIDKVVKENSWREIRGILFDLGVSNIHLKADSRGFSFDNSAAGLDMRLNPEVQGVKASDLLNVLREDQLKEMFMSVMEIGPSRWLAKKVINFRKIRQISTVSDFLQIVEGIRLGKSKISEATLPFLALRIAVNSELDNLKEALPKAFDILVSGGRLVVISFHSTEDEITKNFFRNMNIEKKAKLTVVGPITPGENEIGINRRSRSARLRVLEKI